ncbi:hypothetical protein [Tychonema bourrellyi]|uniref:hypothetical protein n=1 Tax=Tychonema bourrellyi TaxID=54313 RepID=UPI001FE8D9D1|nr:hypothetical protein [Tychonema bourrellyi]
MRLYRRIVGKQPIALTELLPTIRQLSAIEKRELIRILMAEEDISEDIFPLEPYNIYYLPTPYDNFGAGAALMQAMNLANHNEN